MIPVGIFSLVGCGSKTQTPQVWDVRDYRFLHLLTAKVGNAILLSDMFIIRLFY